MCIRDRNKRTMSVGKRSRCSRAPYAGALLANCTKIASVWFCFVIFICYLSHVCRDSRNLNSIDYSLKADLRKDTLRHCRIIGKFLRHVHRLLQWRTRKQFWGRWPLLRVPLKKGYRRCRQNFWLKTKCGWKKVNIQTMDSAPTPGIQNNYLLSTN